MEFKKVAVAIALSAGLASSGLQAATNPPVATNGSSTGNFDITLNNNTQIRIYGLQDVVIDDAGTGVATGTTPVCVASNVDDFNISMSALGGTFELSNTAAVGAGAAAANVPYTLQLQNNVDSDIANGLWGGSGLGEGIQSPTALARSSNDPVNLPANCTGANSYKIKVTPTYTGAAPGVYTGTATVTVSPI
ncbi:hypothetical protein [Endozoicomonas arenosclerae]|uniref:hypothetical protein n=1 Tax=Endozoicomonas arenosclerae TaxID=1633495 RepID=UPI0007812985|nr:hypothetical protein [Endozoicomonas arenosclerae]